MASQDLAESILAVDYGSAYIKAALFDIVAGEYRFVARGERPSSLEGALLRAIREIEAVTSRRLLDDGGSLIPTKGDEGVDAFLATTSVSPPLRVAIMGLSELSLKSALKVAERGYSKVEKVLPWREDFQADLKDLHRSQPEVILLAGGVDGGATSPLVDLADSLASLYEAEEETAKPILLFAGNREARPLFLEKLRGKLQFKAVDNIRPTLEKEDLGGAQRELERIYIERAAANLPWWERFRGRCTLPPMTTANALEIVIRFLAQRYGLNVVGLDLGASSTIVASVLDGHFNQTVRTDLGMAHAIDALLKERDWEDILRWLPLPLDSAETKAELADKILRAPAIPQTAEELLLAQAVARETLRLTLSRARQLWPQESFGPYPSLSPLLDLVLASGGGLRHIPDHGQLALLVIDALQPIGVTNLALDDVALLPQLGALGNLNPSAAAQVLERDGFTNLGTVVAPVGHAREGKIILHFKLSFQGKNEIIEGQARYGSLQVIPLGPGQRATLELRPARGFDIGLGRKGKGATTQVDGGSVGLIIDARGRPLSLPQDEEKRLAKVGEWLQAVKEPRARRAL